MKEVETTLNQINRRQALKMTAGGLGYMALGNLLGNEITPPLKPHHEPKAKRVIYLFQAGGPSQIDLFDYKPKLKKLHGQDIFKHVEQKGRLTGFQGKKQPLINSKYSFKQYGECGSWVSELLPEMSKIVDDLCTIRSVSTKPVNHDPAMTFMQTGHNLPGRPGMGAWLSYGLGSMNNNLPDYVVLVSKGDLGNMQPLNSRLWGNGFLPGRYQGVRLRSGKNPVLYLKDPAGKTITDERKMLDVINKLNNEELKRSANPTIETRISQYEMAFRMQSSIPDLSDLSDEPESTFKLYGEDARKPGTYAFNCLMARRLAERDVRFIQLYHSGWDHHFNLPDHLPKRCRETDQASTALISDLKQRGLLQDTIVVWGGEFGRTAFSQNGKVPKSYGRDHHANCFTKIVAGGGFKSGLNYGETDDFCYTSVKDEVTVHDLHATIMHQLGIDHERLTYFFQGRRFRLTDVHGHVGKDILS
ncbi:MAG: DUF1501 domain-containing protein [Lentisphaerales bacterium]|nr:DUF1501 domain-containing protein [Lentisphaerales bacterium]